MSMLDSLAGSLLSPMVLAFLLGIIATLIRSDLKFPDGFYLVLTIYLLFAIGLKGGVKLKEVSFGEAIFPILAALLLCLLIPTWVYLFLKNVFRVDKLNSAALAIHYGSVSAVTFGECIAFLELMGVSYEKYSPSLLAIMEVPAILVGILLARAGSNDGLNFRPNWKKVFHELLAGKGTLLLVGGIIIGILSGKRGMEQVAPVFETPFRGILTLFLLEVGLVTGRRLKDLKLLGFRIISFGIIFPVIHAILGIFLAKWTGLSMGGSVVFGTLAASASYIAAPAACRIALPEANPSIYLTASLVVTFPFNIVLGLPLYLSFAQWVYGG